jgi:uncharacterized protein
VVGLIIKKAIITLIVLIVLILISGSLILGPERLTLFLKTGLTYILPFHSVEVPDDYSQVDRNNNGIPDPLDLVREARKEAKNKTPYKDGYYAGGYPPDNEGVCTDVIWRAFRGIDVDLKALVDKDIELYTSDYWRVEGRPEPNIDFRRVPNLHVFFQKYAESFTTDIIPGDIENLRQWQPGDIVVIMKPFQHIGIISDKRTKDGVPYFIHNSPPHATEIRHFNLGNFEIVGHYRWKY